jgi:multidrug efflux system membrane fusion protein
MSSIGSRIHLAAGLAFLAVGGAAVAAPSDEPVPVTLGTAALADVPVYIRGLGTVQAYNAVTIKTRVDGQITQVFFTEGQSVHAGDRLFQIDPRPYQAALDEAVAAKQKDEANLHSAKLDLDRYDALVGKGFQTRQSVDQQKAAVDSGQAAVSGDQAAIDAAKLNLTYADIRAPIEGRTGARLVDAGNLVQASAATALVSITQIKPIFVSFTVPQEKLDAIRDNQAKAALEVEAWSSDDQHKLSTGKLTLIDNQIDPATGTVRLKASFENTDERLWPGEFVNARLVLTIRKDAVTVPAATVMQGPSGQFAFVAKPNDTVERRDVEVAATEDGVTVITKGLKSGERIVVSGQYRLSDGSHIRPSAAAAG